MTSAERKPYALGLGKLRRHGFVSVGTNAWHEGMLLTEAFIAPRRPPANQRLLRVKWLPQSRGLRRHLQGDTRPLGRRLRRLHWRLNHPRRHLERRSHPAPAAGNRLRDRLSQVHPPPPPPLLPPQRPPLLIPDRQLRPLNRPRLTSSIRPSRLAASEDRAPAAADLPGPGPQPARQRRAQLYRTVRGVSGIYPLIPKSCVHRAHNVKRGPDGALRPS